MKKNIRDYLHLYPNAKYRVRYVDYEKDTWTVWLNLTLFRLNQILSDSSIEDIQIALYPFTDVEKKSITYVIGQPSYSINQIKYSLDHCMDIFMLIEEGIAIDATTLKKLETDIAK